jgi:glutamate 5-kinase
VFSVFGWQTDPTAQPIRVVTDIHALRVSLGFAAGTAGGVRSGKPCRSGKYGTGGMQTKLVAAQLATAAGVNTVICKSSEVDQLEDVMAVSVLRVVFWAWIVSWLYPAGR